MIRLAAAARDLAPGARLTVWSTDPAARLDVPAWARMRGHTVVGEEQLSAQEGAEAWPLTVEIGGRRAAAEAGRAVAAARRARPPADG